MPGSKRGRRGEFDLRSILGDEFEADEAQVSRHWNEPEETPARSPEKADIDDDMEQEEYLPQNQARPVRRSSHRTTAPIAPRTVQEDEQFLDVPEQETSGASKKNLIQTVVLAALIAVCCAAAAMITPAAIILQKDDQIVDSRRASADIENGLSSLKTNMVSDSLNLPKVYLLPLSNTGGTKYVKSRKSTYKDKIGTHRVYEDPTIKVDIWRQRGKANGSNYSACFAKIKIAHPTQLRTAVSTTGYKNRSKSSSIASKANAIVAVNGDFYTLRKTGVIVKQGTYYRKSSSSRETLFIDEDGNFTIMTAKEAIKSGFLEQHTIYNTMSFGPPLVKNGEVCHYTSSSKDGIAAMHFGNNPRAGVGQLGPLEYLLIVVDGRSSNSAGITTNAFAKLFYNAGCKNAYNLDGGQSATMVYLNDVYNSVSNSGERSVADILYFASAYPEGGNK